MTNLAHPTGNGACGIVLPVIKVKPTQEALK